MALSLNYPLFKAFDTNGNPLAGGKLYSYMPGTTTPMSTYSDFSLSTPNSNPVILNPEGEALVYLSNPTKLVLKNFDDVTMWTLDNIGGISLTGISIKDFGAVADGVTDNVLSIQAAIDAAHAAGGGMVYVPPAALAYNFSTGLVMYDNVELYGAGYASHLHSTNTTRLGGITATGTSILKLTNIAVHDLRLTGLTAATPGVSDGLFTGAGIDFKFCDYCQIYRTYVSNWSDAGISVLCGDYNKIYDNDVQYTAQNIQVVASTIDSNKNIIANNVSGPSNFYNGIHTEGLFGGVGNPGVVRGTVVIGNVSTDAWGQGINIENSPGTVAVGNRVTGAGTGGAGNTLHGIFLYGSPNSTVTGNEIESSAGYGIVVGANSGETAVVGNTTKDNVLGSCLCTDSGVAVSQNIAMGANSFTEGDVVIVQNGPGNVTFLSRTTPLAFTNQASSGLTTLDWYEERSFTPAVEGSTSAGVGTYTEQFGTATRIGNVVNYHLQLAWTGHTGTGDLIISGLPWLPYNAQRFAATVYEGGVPITAGSLIMAYVDQGIATIHINECTAGGVSTHVPMANSCNGINISGSYTTYDTV